MQKFNQLCETNLSHAQYTNLSKCLGVSKFRVNKLLAKPQLAKKSELENLASILGLETVELVNKYEVGLDGMTARQYLELTDNNQNQG